MVATEHSIECVWQAGATLGEGPIWNPQDNNVYWVDIKGQKVFRFGHEDAQKTEWTSSIQMSAIGLPPGGWPSPRSATETRFVAATENGFAWLTLPPSGEVNILPIADPEAHLPGNRFNDGKFGPDGRFYAGTMDDSEKAARGSLYALAADGSVSTIDTGYKVTNGPAFSPCGKWMYHNDSARQIVYRFERATDGTYQGRVEFHRFPPSAGYPDGMTTDRQGNLFIAMWDGGCLEVLSDDASSVERIPLPVSRPTSCIFAGEKLTDLYVTSARIDIDPALEPNAGSLFRISNLA